MRMTRASGSRSRTAARISIPPTWLMKRSTRKMSCFLRRMRFTASSPRPHTLTWYPSVLRREAQLSRRENSSSTTRTETDSFSDEDRAAGAGWDPRSEEGVGSPDPDFFLARKATPIHGGDGGAKLPREVTTFTRSGGSCKRVVVSEQHPGGSCDGLALQPPPPASGASQEWKPLFSPISGRYSRVATCHAPGFGRLGSGTMGAGYQPGSA